MDKKDDIWQPRKGKKNSERQKCRLRDDLLINMDTICARLIAQGGRTDMAKTWKRVYPVVGHSLTEKWDYFIIIIWAGNIFNAALGVLLSECLYKSICCIT